MTLSCVLNLWLIFLQVYWGDFGLIIGNAWVGCGMDVGNRSLSTNSQK